MITMRRFGQCVLTGLALATVSALTLSPAFADIIVEGSDYLETEAGTFFNFGAIINGGSNVNLSGLPLPGFGDADTIVERQDQANCAALTASCGTVDIEIVALSLQSVAPVPTVFGGGLWDVFVVIDGTQGAASTGTMEIFRSNDADDFGPMPEGTFTSNFDLTFDVILEQVVGGGGSMTLNDVQAAGFIGGGLWSYDPPDDLAWEQHGNHPDVTANIHDNLLTGQRDFFPTAIVEQHPGNGVHKATSEDIPEPATLLLFGIGLGGLTYARRRQLALKSE